MKIVIFFIPFLLFSQVLETQLLDAINPNGEHIKYLSVNSIPYTGKVYNYFDNNVRELVGHGIGQNLHEEPQVPNYGRPNEGYKLHAGMSIAIEPMINLGKKEVYTSEDGWTILTVDGKASAHFEHTIAIMEDGPKILSRTSKNG